MFHWRSFGSLSFLRREVVVGGRYVNWKWLSIHRGRFIEFPMSLRRSHGLRRQVSVLVHRFVLQQ